MKQIAKRKGKDGFFEEGWTKPRAVMDEVGDELLSLHCSDDALLGAAWILSGT
jgi:hypothetical protein